MPMTDAAIQEHTLTVALALYNEAESLQPSVEAILSELLPSGWRLDLLIVDDGSRDGSSEIADALATRHACIRIVRHASNQGLGQVYRTGFESAQGEWLTFLPADGQYGMRDVLHLLGAREQTAADLVLGILSNGRESAAGKLLSGLERLMFRLLFGRTPPFQGIFLVRTDRLRQLPIRSRGRGWAIVLEMIIRADRAGFRWVNEPVCCRQRLAGQSKVANFRMVVLNLLQLLRLRWLLGFKPSQIQTPRSA
jgi:dolichol-phosphate mannosyltransferase